MTRDLPLIERIRQFVAEKGFQLPVFGETAVRMKTLAQREDFDMREAERIIQSDQALTAEVLRITNSSFFGGLAQVLSIRAAIVRSANVPLAIVRLADQACAKVCIAPLHDEIQSLAVLPETVALGASNVMLAELEIMLEDAFAAP